MLSDMLKEYKEALLTEDKARAKKALANLSKVGVDKMTADILVREV